MAQVWANNAISTLSAGISSSDVTVFIQASHGSRFPVVTAPNIAYCALEDSSGNIEIVKVTAHSSGGTSMTVVRGQQGTTARAYIIGDLFELRMTAVEATAWEADIDDLELTRARKAGDTYTGTHNFSAATQVILPANTSIGNVSAAEILTLDGITGNIQAQLNSKGAIAGQTWTGVHVFPSTVTIGPVSDIEIGYLDGVTASIQGQLNLKAAKAGDTYTGTHDFTGANPTGSTPAANTNDSGLATHAFVQQVAFASLANLPADPADLVTRVLTTLSGVKSWDPIPNNDLANYAAGIV